MEIAKALDMKATEVDSIRDMMFTVISINDIEVGEDYDKARKKAKQQDLIKAVAQTEDHKKFIGMCVPELKEKFSKVENIEKWEERMEVMGMEHVEQHESPKVDDKAFNDFLSLTKELNKASFADCKWKQQIKEVIV